MNSFSTIYARMNERTKLILVAVIAFFLGGLLKGGGSSGIGRYQACGNSPTYLVDTAKGTTWELKGNRYQELGSMPSW